MRYFLHLFLIISLAAFAEDSVYLNTDPIESDYFKSVECDLIADPPHACWKNNCGRRIADNLFEPEDISNLLSIAQKGLALRAAVGGPTIVDINTGFIRDSEGIENMFARSEEVYTPSDFSVYGAIIKKLKNYVMSTFDITELYFTAPTFITRLDGRPSWTPQDIHDEYWHVHADMNNTRHYQYSGLLYLSTYGSDFKGGRLHFVSPSNFSHSEEIVVPVAGRVVIFTSGAENPHYVERVTGGQRFVLAFWFTCNPKNEFEIFLDGKAHAVFSRRVGAGYKTQATEEL